MQYSAIFPDLYIYKNIVIRKILQYIASEIKETLKLYKYSSAVGVCYLLSVQCYWVEASIYPCAPHILPVIDTVYNSSSHIIPFSSILQKMHTFVYVGWNVRLKKT